MPLDIKPPEEKRNSKRGLFSIFQGEPMTPQELKKKGDELDERESEINRATRDLQKDQKAWEKLRKKLQDEIQRMELKKKEMKQYGELQKIPEQIIKKREELDGFENALHDKDISLNVKEKAIRQREREVEKANAIKARALNERDRALTDLEKIRAEAIIVNQFLKDNIKNLKEAKKAKEMIKDIEEANSHLNEKSTEIERQKKELQVEVGANREILSRRDNALKQSEVLVQKIQWLKEERDRLAKEIRVNKKEVNNLGKYITSKTNDMTKKEVEFGKEAAKLEKLKEVIRERELGINEKEKKIKKAYAEGESVVKQRIKIIEGMDSLRANERELTRSVNEKKRVLEAVEKDIKGQVTGFKKKEEEFMKKVAELQSYESGVHEVESKIKARENMIAERERGFAAREKSIIEKEKGEGLDRQKILKEIEGYRQEIIQLAQQRESLSHEIEKRKEALQQFPKINKAQQGLQRIKVAIDKQQADLEIREQDLKENTLALRKKEARFRNDIRKSISLIKKKDTLDAEIESKTELVRQFPRMALLEKDLEKLKAMLAMKKTELAKQAEELKSQSEEIGTREEEVANREAKWLSTEAEIKNLKETLLTERHMLEDYINASRAELDGLSDEWANIVVDLEKKKSEIDQLKSSTHSMIKNNVTALEEREVDVVKRIHELEDDQRKLRKQEKLILDKLKSLEISRQRFAGLDERERALNAMKMDMEKREKELEKEVNKTISIRRKLEKKEAKIANVKALKENLPALERRYLKLNNMAKGAAAKLMGATTEQLVKREQLKEFESDVRAREAWIAKDMEAIEEGREDLMKRSADVKLKESEWRNKEVEAYNRYLKENLAKETVVEQTSKEAKYPKIYGMLGKIKSLIDAGELERAKATLTSLEDIYGKIISLEDKRLINYDLNEARTNLKLASLA